MAKVVKLKDRQSNPILPLTRSTVVEMNDGLSLQTAYDAINLTHYTKSEIDSAGYLTYTQANSYYVSYSYLDEHLSENYNDKTLSEILYGDKYIVIDDYTWDDNTGEFTANSMAFNNCEFVGDAEYILLQEGNILSNTSSIKYIYDGSSSKSSGGTGIGFGSNNSATTKFRHGTYVLSYTVSKIMLNGTGTFTLVSDLEETDPTVPAHVKSITEDDIAYWNAAAQETMFIEIGYDENEDTMIVLSDIEFSDIVDAWNANKRISIIYDNMRYDCLFCQENNCATFNWTSGEGPNFIYGTAINILPGKSGLDVKFDEYEIGYDSEPTADSNNLMTSGDIYNYITPFIVTITQEKNTYFSSINAKDLYDNYITKGITVYVSDITNIYTLKYCDSLTDCRIWFESIDKIILLSSEYNMRTQTYTHSVNKYDKYDTAVMQNSDKPLTSGAVYTALSSYVSKTELNSASYISSSSLNTTLSSYATSANYDSNTKKIYLKHGTRTLSEIDATDFIKDGMVDTAYVQGTNLVISFNTDAGKEAVNVPIANIFNANNYYTKSQIDTNVIHLTGDPNFYGEGTVTCAWEVDDGIPSNYTSILQAKIENYAPDALAHEDNYYCFEAICNLFPSGGTTDVFTISRTMYKALNTAAVEIDEEIEKLIIPVNPTSYATISDYMNYTESDPTVPNHVKSITEQNITDWNNKLSSETQLSKGTTTGSGNAVTDISVSNHQITLTKGSTFLTEHQSIKTINGNTITGTGNVTISEMPTVTSSDNGKILQVVNGAWTLVTPLNLYSGTGAPDNSQGNNGDLYMQI